GDEGRLVDGRGNARDIRSSAVEVAFAQPGLDVEVDGRKIFGLQRECGSERFAGLGVSAYVKESGPQHRMDGRGSGIETLGLPGVLDRVIPVAHEDLAVGEIAR